MPPVGDNRETPGTGLTPIAPHDELPATDAPAMPIDPALSELRRRIVDVEPAQQPAYKSSHLSCHPDRECQRGGNEEEERGEDRVPLQFRQLLATDAIEDDQQADHDRDAQHRDLETVFADVDAVSEQTEHDLTLPLSGCGSAQRADDDQDEHHEQDRSETDVHSCAPLIYGPSRQCRRSRWTSRSGTAHRPKSLTPAV